MKLLTLSNPKVAKSAKMGWLTAVLHLHPGLSVCPDATKGCLASCLNRAGRGGIFKRGETTNAILEARKRKTKWWLTDPDSFMTRLNRDVWLLARRARKMGLKPALRPNGTSDVAWERTSLLDCARDHGVKLYDYTKSPDRAVRQPYQLHYSFSEKSDWPLAQSLLGVGVSVVVVSMTGDPVLLAEHMDLNPTNCISGDEHDLRFLDPPGSLVVVKAKGPARHDRTGFVLRC